MGISICAIHNGKEYPVVRFFLYSNMREIKKRYREVHGLKGRHNVVFITV